ncbi:MAG: choice-of-anchor D domain-containing protein [Acidobacteriota bacterium]|nr:choice-of-anchor D domain-containing protein [Acidobacteriota bacterium]
MRPRFVWLIVLLVVGPGVFGHAFAQSCSGNQTTSVSGNVYAPNGIDPLPNVTVYIPTTTVDPFTPGVSCPIAGAPLSGSPLVGSITDVNGHFQILGVPVASNIPLVMVSGRWRKQLTIPSVTACVDNPMPANFAVMPQNQSQGDIPKIAIATGAVDQVECVLRKMGIDQAEFTDPAGSGRINLYTASPIGAGSIGAGARVDAATPSAAALMGDTNVLNSYDVLMLPCEGGQTLPARPAAQLANLLTFANSGGRVYASHFSYDWLFQNPPFDKVANWAVNQASLPNGNATVDVSFTGGKTLADWLQLPVINASTSYGQMALNTLRHDLNGVIAPTRSWLTLNTGTAKDPNPVMQLVFDTPIPPAGLVVNQCGRVLFNEYHVESGNSSPNVTFPAECDNGPMTPQEKLLEYMLFELTDEGGQPSLDPATQSFGSEAIGFPSAAKTFTWTNNSSFTLRVSGVSSTGDFALTSNNCGTVLGGASCQITVVYTPTALGPVTGTLSVTAQGFSQTSALTGTGTPGYTLSGSTLAYGNLDIGAKAAQTLTLSNIASGPLPTPPFVTTGQYQVSTSACGATIAAGASCQVSVTFVPTVTGPQSGTLGVNSSSLLYNGLSATLTGNGVDFTLSLNPTSGSVIAGDSTSTTATLTPIAGFSSPISLVCQIGAVATNCGLSTSTFTPTAVTTVTVSLATTSQFTVIGYGGFGGRGYLWLVGLGSGLLLWRGRRKAGAMLRSGLAVALLAAIGLGMSGCTGKLPAANAAYTGPGSYTVKMTATDGFLVHSATYTLSVTAK